MTVPPKTGVAIAIEVIGKQNSTCIYRKISVLNAVKIIDFTPFFSGKVARAPGDAADISLEECLARAQKSAEADVNLFSRSDFNLDDWVTYNFFLSDILRRTGRSIEFVRASEEDLSMISPLIVLGWYAS